MGDEVVDTPFGKFLINPLDGIGMTTKAGTLWDGPGFLQPIAIEHGGLGEIGTTILDVGANIGTFTVWLARQDAWRVIAVEPIPQTRSYLRANLDLNKDVCASRVIVIETAAYDRVCQMDFGQEYDPNNMGAGELVPREGGSILAAPLDVYRPLFGRRVSLIKIDTQGCDFAVMQGLELTIRQWRPTIVFEWEGDARREHGGQTFDEVTSWLATRGYRVLAWPSQPNNYIAVRASI